MAISLFAFSSNSLPWNQETLVGYFGEIFYDTLTTEAGLFVYGSITVIFIFMCLHDQAFYEMIESAVKIFGHTEEGEIPSQSLCKLIRFHISARE